MCVCVRESKCARLGVRVCVCAMALEHGNTARASETAAHSTHRRGQRILGNFPNLLLLLLLGAARCSSQMMIMGQFEQRRRQRCLGQRRAQAKLTFY